jgi:hypothetical protein
MSGESEPVAIALISQKVDLYRDEITRKRNSTNTALAGSPKVNNTRINIFYKYMNFR